MQRAFAVDHLGRRYLNGMRQSLRVDGDMALDPRNLLARVIALLACRVGVLHALRVHDQERAAGVAPPVSRGPRQPDFLSARSSKLIPSSSTSLHLAKYECTFATSESRWAMRATDNLYATGTALRTKPRTGLHCAACALARLFQNGPNLFEPSRLMSLGHLFLRITQVCTTSEKS